MSASFDNLKSQRAGYRSALTRLYSQTVADDDFLQLKNVLTKLDKYESKLIDLDSQIATVMVGPEEIEMDVCQSIEIQDKLGDYRNYIQSKIDAHCPNSVSGDGEVSIMRNSIDMVPNRKKVHLPKLELEKFDGDPLHWVTFWDIFNSSVHSNTGLTNVDKFSYLKSLLKGNAATCIAGFSITNANYDQAISLLHERFGQSHVIINAHMEALLDVPSASNNTKLRSIFDEAERHIRALEALGITADTYGIVIAPMLLKKFPNDVRLIISRAQSNAVWDLQELRKELKKEIEARERSTVSTGHKEKPTESKMAVGSLVTRAKVCPFCDCDHDAFTCSLAPEERWNAAKGKRLCYVCLRGNHSAKYCRSGKKCGKCYRYHHTTLCNPERQHVKAKSSIEKDDSAKPANNLKGISLVFDPHGWLSPLTLRGKLLMQEIWKEKIKWDEPVSQHLEGTARELFQEYRNIGNVTFQRSFGTMKGIPVEIHTFVDASMKAFGAVLYMRFLCKDEIVVKLVCSKTRVAPLKGQTLPRLELLGILIGTRLSLYVKEQFQSDVRTVTVWSDSQIALAWLRSSKTLTPFVSNRVSEIKRSGFTFDYVCSEENPADMATRGTNLKKLMASQLWWYGPSWLSTVEGMKIQAKSMDRDLLTERKEEHNTDIVMVAHSSTPQQVKLIWPQNSISVDRFQSMTRLFRVTSWCNRAVNKLKGSGTWEKYLAACELELAHTQWDRSVQNSAFENEINLLLRGKRNQLINQLNLMLDSDEIIRCKGRFDNIELRECPKLLPKKHNYTNLIIRYYHQKLLHSGVRHTLNTIRSRYWILQGRQAVKVELSKCVICRQWEGKPFSDVPVAPLPDLRVTETIPFKNTGIDFLGPLYIKGDKIWLCLFSCAVTRALHLEIVSNMSTKEFILCLRRFIATCGTPHVLISDNAKTFVLAKEVVQNLWASVVCDVETQDYISAQGITWKFNVPRAPWWGGFYERMVGMVKRLLKKSIGKAHINRTEMETQIKEIVAIINSRPLTYIYNTLNDGISLTPNDLCGIKQKHGIPPAEDIDILDVSYNETSAECLSRRARYSIRLLEKFWRIWREEYLTTLREHHTSLAGKQKQPGRVIAIGDVVLIKDDLPRAQWKMGLVKQLIEGKDGFARAAVIKTKLNTIRRPLRLLCPLEVRSTESSSIEDNNVIKDSIPKRKAATDALIKMRRMQKSD